MKVDMLDIDFDEQLSRDRKEVVARKLVRRQESRNTRVLMAPAQKVSHLFCRLLILTIAIFNTVILPPLARGRHDDKQAIYVID